ncbi:hypothetical protein [Amycolatopsis australiensis]|uniref:Secreted protein n=1 Tax=Amycolatopsis australiensis TaxID=546364 RepID=A0A1K1T1K0_9PSEU|nr:hypothetical protein [Amycolatopsis australiensis]SFW90513.1 hypothetical protein SAMN04489730_7596 [Amycolatopsis australiensis]
MHFSKKLAGAAAVALGLATAGVWTASAASSATAADGDTQPSLVEDYSYPGAAAIQAQYHVTLISGDGHIVFADCATPPVDNVSVMQVRSTEDVGTNGLVCFKVLAPAGHLELRIPAVYEIRGDGRASGAGHKVKAEVTTDAGQHSTVDVNPSGSTQVGIGANPNNPPATLLQLTAAP